MSVNDFLAAVNPTTVQGTGTWAGALIAYLVSQGLGPGVPLFGRFFERRFARCDIRELQIAIKRLDVFVVSLTQRVNELGITESRLEDEYAKPDQVAALRAAFDAAVETDDVDKAKILGQLAADRLLNDSESLSSITTRRAVELMRDLNGLHLRLLALCEAVSMPLPRGMIGAFGPYLEKYVSPFLETKLSYPTVAHLSSLGLVVYDFKHLSIADATAAPILSRATAIYPRSVFNSATADRISERWDGNPRAGIIGLSEIELRPVGRAIAAAALRVLVGLEIGQPEND